MKTCTFFALMLMTGLAVAQIPANGLLSHLPLDGSPADNEGYFAALAVSAAGVTIPAAADRAGNASGAVVFNGTSPANSAYYIQDIPSTLALPDTAVSLAVWVLPTDNELYSTIFDIRLNQEVAPFNSLWMGILSDGQFAAAVTTHDASDVQANGGAAGMTDFKSWAHVAMTYSSAQGTLKLYVNGVLRDTKNVTGNIAYPAAPNVTIGNQETQPYHRFWGRMDDLALYNRALTAAEIGTMAGLSGSEATTTAIPVRLFPNPACDRVQVQTTAPLQAVRVLDLTGRAVLESAATTIEIAALPAGLYLVQVQTAQGTGVQRLVKE